MGTAKQWIEVAITGGFWTAFTLLWDLVHDRKPGRFASSYMLATILSGFAFGVVMTFGWRTVFTPPLAYVVIPAIVAIALLGFHYRHTYGQVKGKLHSSPD
jgi:hypothetical protein